MPCLGAYALSATQTRDPLITSREHEPIYYSASTIIDAFCDPMWLMYSSHSILHSFVNYPYFQALLMYQRLLAALI